MLWRPRQTYAALATPIALILQHISGCSIFIRETSYRHGSRRMTDHRQSHHRGAGKPSYGCRSRARLPDGIAHPLL